MAEVVNLEEGGEPESAFPIIESESEVLIITNPRNSTYSCLFCKQFTVDELNLGPLYRLPEEEVVVHYFCMLFSAGLVQQGNDREGIMGFMPVDILKESRRAHRLKCSYCQLNGASIGCNTSRCKVSFHFPCGLQNDANFQFFRNYQAFCISHSTLPPVETPLSERKCPICLSLVDPPERPIVGPCCKGAIFHKTCLQRLALNAGYFFKCPTCNSVAEFPEKAKLQGIFVPEQDASWEREPHAYSDLYQVYEHCDAEDCECPRGRDYGAQKGSWLLARCRICGSAGTHRTCGKLKTIANWACAPCLEVEVRTQKNKQLGNSSRNSDEPMPSTSTGDTGAAGIKKKKAVQTNILKWALPMETSVKKMNQSASTKNATTNKTKSDGSSEIPNKRAKRSGFLMGSVPFEFDEEDEDEEDEDENFDLAQVHINPACFDYFPFTQEEKTQFAETHGIFPDWRKFQVGVELVDIFIDAIDAVENPVQVEPASVEQQVAEPVSEASSEKENKAVSETSISSKNVKSRKTGGRKRKPKRSSNWSKGLVKRKKKSVSPSKRKPALTLVLPLPDDTDCTTEPESESSDQSTASTPTLIDHKTVSDSPSVLVGIRRSQESLLQLQAQSSTKGDDTNNPEVEQIKNDSSSALSEVNIENFSFPNGLDQSSSVIPESNNLAVNVNQSQTSDLEPSVDTTLGSPSVMHDTNGESDTWDSTENDSGLIIASVSSISASDFGIQSVVNGASISENAIRSEPAPAPVVKIEVGVDEDKQENLNPPPSSSDRSEIAVMQSAIGLAQHLAKLSSESEKKAQMNFVGSTLRDYFNSIQNPNANNTSSS